jgi:hypothetical protein
MNAPEAYGGGGSDDYRFLGLQNALITRNAATAGSGQGDD